MPLSVTTLSLRFSRLGAGTYSSSSASLNPGRRLSAYFLGSFAPQIAIVHLSINLVTSSDVNIDTTAMLDTAWNLFAAHFTPAEVNIKQELVDKYWKK